MLLNRIVLGTAQFGMNYGISNKIGKINQKEISKILNFASTNKIRYLDTAASYKKSELEIGNFCKTNNIRFKIITKYSLKKNVEDQFLNSIRNIGSQPEIVMAHSVNDYLNIEFHRAVNKLKKNYKIKKIGVSLYNPDELKLVLSYKRPDIVQFPVNILDQRFVNKKIYKILKKNSIEIHARSVFLQGFFFLKNSVVKKNFPEAIYMLNKLREIANYDNLSISQLSLLWVYSQDFIDKIIIGVDSLQHLKSNIKCLKKKISLKSQALISKLNFNNQKIINPNLWKIK